MDGDANQGEFDERPDECDMMLFPWSNLLPALFIHLPPPSNATRKSVIVFHRSVVYSSRSSPYRPDVVVVTIRSLGQTNDVNGNSTNKRRKRKNLLCGTINQKSRISRGICTLEEHTDRHTGHRRVVAYIPSPWVDRGCLPRLTTKALYTSLTQKRWCCCCCECCCEWVSEHMSSSRCEGRTLVGMEWVSVYDIYLSLSLSRLLVTLTHTSRPLMSST